MQRTWSPPFPDNARAAIFLAVGLLFFSPWLQVGSADDRDPQTLNDWIAVVGFSVALACLAMALPPVRRADGQPNRVSSLPDPVPRVRSGRDHQ